MNKPISRQEESLLPSFNSHEDARHYFTDLYGTDFVFESADYIGDQMCYFYALIINREEYERGQELLKNGTSVSGFDFLYSYQSIQIMKSGSVHIVH